MWIALKSSSIIITEKGVACKFDHNSFLFVMQPQTLKPFGWEHFFNYRLDILDL